MSNALQAINSLDQTINSFKSRVDVKVNNVNTSTASIQATTNKIYDNIEKFKTQMLHGEEKQIAHENILRIDQIIKEQFSNHIAIRRTVMGVVRDFDINLVRNSTIQELSEELWITSSRYWLSYALIAITAWVNDYPDVAKNALAESGRKDAIKTTLFFCLLNMRFGRVEAAKKWFYEYFKTLDPTMLQQETAVLLQSFLNGIFGKDKELEQEIIRLIDEWISIINDNEQISNELLDAYEKYIIDEYSTVVNFKREDEEQEKINSFYNEKRDTAVSTIKNWPAYIGFGVGAAAIAGSFFVGFWLLILTFAGVGYGAFTLLTNKSKRKQIEMSCDESKKATSAAMRQLFAEFKQYQKELDEYDAYHDRILDEIHKV